MAVWQIGTSGSILPGEQVFTSTGDPVQQSEPASELMGQGNDYVQAGLHLASWNGPGLTLKVDTFHPASCTTPGCEAFSRTNHPGGRPGIEYAIERLQKVQEVGQV